MPRVTDLNDHGRGMLRSLRKLDRKLAPQLEDRARLARAVEALGLKVPPLSAAGTVDGRAPALAPPKKVLKAAPKKAAPKKSTTKKGPAKKTTKKHGSKTATAMRRPPIKPSRANGHANATEPPTMSAAILNTLGAAGRPLPAGVIRGTAREMLKTAYRDETFYVALGRLAKTGRVVADGPKGSRMYRLAAAVSAPARASTPQGGAATR